MPAKTIQLDRIRTLLSVSSNLPWLVAALARSIPKSAPPEDVVQAAKAVPVGSPAYITVQYLLGRLYLQTGSNTEAKHIFDQLLAPAPVPVPVSAKPNLSTSDRNLILQSRVTLAPTAKNWLQYAVQRIAETVVEDETPAISMLPVAPGNAWRMQWTITPLATGPTAMQLNHCFSSHQLAKFSADPNYPEKLKPELEAVVFVRSFILKDDVLAQRMARALVGNSPVAAAFMRDYIASADRPSERRFAAALAILHLPGIQPTVRAGLPREFESIGQVPNSWADINSFRDNWWPSPFLAQNALKLPVECPKFTADNEKATAEWLELDESDAQGEVIPVVLSFAKAHPDDPRAPQALYLAVRMTHYSATQNGHLSCAAFDILHRNYPASAWTKKTPYCYTTIQSTS